jgi:hypothetical protein
MAFRQRADLAARLIGHAAGDEALDSPGVVDDPEGGVFGAHERPNTIDDELQDLVRGCEPGDAADGGVEGRPYLGGACICEGTFGDALGGRLGNRLGGRFGHGLRG